MECHGWDADPDVSAGVGCIPWRQCPEWGANRMIDKQVDRQVDRSIRRLFS